MKSSFLHWRLLVVVAVMLTTATLDGVVVALAQFGGSNIETYQNRKVGAPPEAVQTAIDGDFEALRRLWQSQRMDIFERDQQQRSVLMTAVIYDRAEMLNFLLDNGADVHAIDETGNSALHFAALRGNIGAINALLAHGARIDQQNANGETALMLSIKSEQEKAIMCLLESGADTQLSDFTASTISDYVAGVKDRKLRRKLMEWLD